MTPEQISAIPTRLSQRAAGIAPKLLGRSMPNSHASSADAQQQSIATKQSDSTVKRRMNTLELCTECQLLQLSVYTASCRLFVLQPLRSKKPVMA